MALDQAAGLRRRSARQSVRCIHCISETVECSTRLALALHRHGWTSLLVDTLGRVFADAPVRNLFDWRQQIARGQLHTLPMPYGDGWHAPDMRANEPLPGAIARGYDCLLLDTSLNNAAGLLDAAAREVILEVRAGRAPMLQTYALLKGMSRTGTASVTLLGDSAACAHLQAAARQFLDPAFSRALWVAANEDDAFAALAVRMRAEETGLATR
jgi:hypothetical protein